MSHLRRRGKSLSELTATPTASALPEELLCVLAHVSVCGHHYFMKARRSTYPKRSPFCRSLARFLSARNRPNDAESKLRTSSTNSAPAPNSIHRGTVMKVRLVCHDGDDKISDDFNAVMILIIKSMETVTLARLR